MRKVHFMKFRLAHALFTFAITLLIACSANAQTTNDTRFDWWRQARFGMFIHWGPISMRGTEIGWSRGGYRADRMDSGTEVPAEEYDNLYKQFSPTNFNATAWVEAAKTAGMKYLVFTAKHHDGFCEFDSKFTDYKITKSPLGRDVCAELADACHKAGIHLGFYYSPPDWHHPDFCTTNHSRYIDYLHGQVRELLSNYGKVDILWFDADGGTNRVETWDAQNLIKMVRQLQPQILLTKRCADIGDFDTPEQHVGAFQTTPWETCMTICQQWSYKPNDNLKSLKQCLHTLIFCAGGDGNLLFNVAPGPDGSMEPRQIERLHEIGDWLQKNGDSIYGTRGGPWKPNRICVSTRKDNFVFVHVIREDAFYLELPDLPRPIKSATLLDGTPVKFSQKNGTLALNLPPSKFDFIDTVVRLELEGSAMDLPIIERRSSVQATASNTFHKMYEEWGPQFAFDNDSETRWATDEGIKQAWVSVKLPQIKLVRRVRIQEAYGERINKFEFQFRNGGDWITIFSGTKIGFSFEKEFPPVKAKEFRLNILDSSEGPTINYIELLSL